ncbi:MFS transporter [Lutibacter flavus]|nr:MFS transporter [Lutibacter flavus]
MNSTKNYSKSFSLLTSLFFMWGFITVMNDILINTFKGVFNLSPTQRALIQFSFFGAFFIISLIYYLISSSKGKDPINKIGYKSGMAISLLICGIGCVSFYGAAHLNSYNAFLFSLFILASGVTLLQICANPYATILGKKGSESSRLNLAQGFNSLGTTLGPIVGTILIYKVFSTGELTAFSISKTYLAYGIIFIILAIIVKFSNMPSFQNNEKIGSGAGVFKHRQLTLGVLAIFFYVGSEVAIGSWIVEYLKDENIVGMSEENASYFLSFFWGGLMIGRLMASYALNSELSKQRKYLSMAIIGLVVFMGIYLVTGIKMDAGSFAFSPIEFSKIAMYIAFIALCFVAFIIGDGKPSKSLVVFSCINFVLLTIAVLAKGQLAFIVIISTGLFFSIGWTNIFSLAISNLGKYTSQGSSLLVMAVVGGAILPLIQSVIIEKVNVQTSFIIPIFGMLYLIYYGLSGYKPAKIIEE